MRTPLRTALRLLGLVLQHDVLPQPGLLVGRQQVRASQKLPELRRQDGGRRLSLLSGYSLALTCATHEHLLRNTLAGMPPGIKEWCADYTPVKVFRQVSRVRALSVWFSPCERCAAAPAGIKDASVACWPTAPHVGGLAPLACC